MAAYPVPEDARAAGEAAHQPVDHVAKGAHGRIQQQDVGGDRDQRAQAELMADDGDAADPHKQDGDDVDHEDHQRLVPGREAHRAQVEVAQLLIFCIELVDLELFTGKGFDDADAAQALLHHGAQRTRLVLHAQPEWAQETRHLVGEEDEDGDADQGDQCQVPIKRKQHDADRAEGDNARPDRGGVPSGMKLRTASISTVMRDINCPVSDSSWKAKLRRCRCS